MKDLNLVLDRFSGDTDSTIGTLKANGKLLAFTLEDEHRDFKVMHETRIQADTYEIILRDTGGMHARYLERFGDEFHHGMLWLQDVSGFTWIYLHMGLVDGHTSGCVLVGDGVMQNVTRAGQLFDTEIAYKRVYALIASTLMAGYKVTITIND